MRRLGLLHIVVLSGSHLAVLSLCALCVLRFIPLLLFNLRILTMRTWPIFWSGTVLVSVFLMVLFSFVVGMPQTIQRAIVLCLLLQLSEIFWIKKSNGEMLIRVWLLQTILFPVHILSLSMYLSWSGSLVLSGFLTSHFRKSWIALMRERLMIQSIFALCTCLVFGQIGLASIFANLFFGPLFSLALPANIVVLFGMPRTKLSEWLVASQMYLLQKIRELDAWQSDHPWMTFRLPEWIISNRAVAIGLQCGFLFVLALRVFHRTRRRQMENS